MKIKAIREQRANEYTFDAPLFAAVVLGSRGGIVACAVGDSETELRVKLVPAWERAMAEFKKRDTGAAPMWETYARVRR